MFEIPGKFCCVLSFSLGMSSLSETDENEPRMNFQFLGYGNYKKRATFTIFSAHFANNLASLQLPHHLQNL